MVFTVFVNLVIHIVLEAPGHSTMVGNIITVWCRCPEWTSISHTISQQLLDRMSWKLVQTLIEVTSDVEKSVVLCTVVSVLISDTAARLSGVNHYNNNNSLSNYSGKALHDYKQRILSGHNRTVFALFLLDHTSQQTVVIISCFMLLRSHVSGATKMLTACQSPQNRGSCSWMSLH